MAVAWADAADKHGIDREDALHAIMRALYVEREFDEPRPGARPVVVHRSAASTHVLHVTAARQKHLDRMGEQKAGPGQRARTRQVRLPQDLDAWLNEYAATAHRTPSDVLREALSQ